MKFNEQFSLAATGEAAIAGLGAVTELIETQALVGLLIGLPLALFLVSFTVGIRRRP